MTATNDTTRNREEMLKAIEAAQRAREVDAIREELEEALGERVITICNVTSKKTGNEYMVIGDAPTLVMTPEQRLRETIALNGDEQKET